MSGPAATVYLIDKQKSLAGTVDMPNIGGHVCLGESQKQEARMLKPSITALSTRVLADFVRSRVSRLYLVLMVSILLTMVAGDALAAKGFCVNGIFFPHLKLPQAGKCKLVTGGYSLF